MAEGLNKVMLFGNLGADPELHSTANGQDVLKIRLATTETYFDRDKVRQERTEWHRVTLFGKRAVALSTILKKGMRVLVEGRLETSSYEKDGVKRYSTSIIATDVWLAGSARSNGAMPPPRAEPALEELPF